MKAFTIRENEAGQRLDKYLRKLLPDAPGSFIYKMLRKKNITLNGKKAQGSEKLSAGDHVKLFFSEETFEKFSGKQEVAKAVCPSSSSARINVITTAPRRRSSSFLCMALCLDFLMAGTSPCICESRIRSQKYQKVTNCMHVCF